MDPWLKRMGVHGRPPRLHPQSGKSNELNSNPGKGPTSHVAEWGGSWTPGCGGRGATNREKVSEKYEKRGAAHRTRRNGRP